MLWTRRTRIRSLRFLALALAATLVVALWTHYLFPTQRSVAPGSRAFAALKATGHQRDAPLSLVKDVCHSHGFPPHRASGRKVYDLVLISTELDWLEIRLHTLAPFVDYFIVVESPTTFTGNPKPLHLRDNWKRFARFHAQIIRRVVEDRVESQRLWDHEAHFRNSLLYDVFPALTGTSAEPRQGDVLIVGDVDEIVRPETALVLRHCDFPARLTLSSQFYYFSFQWLHRGEQWAHPQATVFAGDVDHTLSPEALRMGLLGPGWAVVAALRRWRDRATLWNAGWHCSFCFATIADTQTKMQSFSHQSLNSEENRDPKNIIRRFREGIDPFDRPDQMYDKVEDNTDVPDYILQQNRKSGRFGYMLNRDDEHAAFLDADVILR